MSRGGIVTRNDRQGFGRADVHSITGDLHDVNLGVGVIHIKRGEDSGGKGAV